MIDNRNIPSETVRINSLDLFCRTHHINPKVKEDIKKAFDRWANYGARFVYFFLAKDFSMVCYAPYFNTTLSFEKIPENLSAAEHDFFRKHISKAAKFLNISFGDAGQDEEFFFSQAEEFHRWDRGFLLIIKR